MLEDDMKSHVDGIIRRPVVFLGGLHGVQEWVSEGV